MINPGEERHTLTGPHLTRATLRQFRLIGPILLFAFGMLGVGVLHAGPRNRDVQAPFLMTMVMFCGAAWFGGRLFLQKYELFISADRVRFHLGIQPEVSISREEVTGIIDRPGDWLVVSSGRRGVAISYSLPAFEALRARVLAWCPPDKIRTRNVLVETLLPAVVLLGALLGGLFIIFATDNPWVVAPISAGIVLFLGWSIWALQRSNYGRKIKNGLLMPSLGILVIALVRFAEVLASAR